MAAAVVSRGIQRVNDWLSGAESPQLAELPAANPRPQDREPPGSSLSSRQIRPQVVEGAPSFTYSQGGRFVKVYVPGAKGKGGGARRAISQFSAKSRHALLTWVNSIDQGLVPAGRVRLVTLTYPASFPAARSSKQHLKRLLQRFRRCWGPCAAFWKLEPQVRGAPHYHLLVFMESQDTLPAEVTWWATNWAEIVDSGERNHLRWHLGQLGNGNEPCVQEIRSWNGVTSYAAKYLGKAFVAGEDWHLPGRFWGIHCREKLPITLHSRELTLKQAAVLRRACCRWYEHQASGRYRWEWSIRKPGRNHVQRAFKTVGEVALMRETGYEMRPYHRRWKWSKGGCSMFMPASAAEKLVRWVLGAGGDRECSQKDFAADPAAVELSARADVGG